MSALPLRALLQPGVCGSLQFVRFRHCRINIQKPAKPHYERARVIKVCKPKYVDPRQGMSLVDLCEKSLELNLQKEEEENPYERFLAREVMNWFSHSKMIAFYHANPIPSEFRFKVNIMLKRHNMHLKQYGRKVMKLALENTKYEAVLQLFTSHNFMVFSAEPQAATLMKVNRRIPQLILMAAVVEDRLLGLNELVEYSKIPNIQSAQASLVAVLNTASVQLAQNLLHHQQTLVGHLQKHIELQQNKNDTKDS